MVGGGANNKHWATSWAEEDAAYVDDTNVWSTWPPTSISHLKSFGYPYMAYALSAVSMLYSRTDGDVAWDWIAGEFLDHSFLADPKWAITPVIDSESPTQTSLIITGNKAAISSVPVVQQQADSLVIFPKVAVVSSPRSVSTASPDTLQINQYSANITLQKGIAGELDTLQVNQYSALIQVGNNLNVASDTLTITGQAASITGDKSVSALVDSLFVRGKNAHVKRNYQQVGDSCPQGAAAVVSSDPTYASFGVNI